METQSGLFKQAQRLRAEAMFTWHVGVHIVSAAIPLPGMKTNKAVRTLAGVSLKAHCRCREGLW